MSERRRCARPRTVSIASSGSLPGSTPARRIRETRSCSQNACRRPFTQMAAAAFCAAPLTPTTTLPDGAPRHLAAAGVGSIREAAAEPAIAASVEEADSSYMLSAERVVYRRAIVTPAPARPDRARGRLKRVLAGATEQKSSWKLTLFYRAGSPADCIDAVVTPADRAEGAGTGPVICSTASRTNAANRSDPRWFQCPSYGKNDARMSSGPSVVNT